MADLSQDLKDFAAKADAETTRIGGILSDLIAKNKNSLTDAERADVNASFTALVDHLKAVGADPTNPIPPESPAMVAAKKLAAKK